MFFCAQVPRCIFSLRIFSGQGEMPFHPNFQQEKTKDFEGGNNNINIEVVQAEFEKL